MTCSTCGRENPAHLTFCQECGQRLGPRVAPPTPPIGITAHEVYDRPASPSQDRAHERAHDPALVATSLGLTSGVVDPTPAAPAVMSAPRVATGERRCRVCETLNGASLRYCTSCGSSLDRPATTPNANAAQPARGGEFVAKAPAPEATRRCNRCHGVVDGTAQFCKFCGNGLAELSPGHSLPHDRLDLPRRPVQPSPSPSIAATSTASPSSYGPPPLPNGTTGAAALAAIPARASSATGAPPIPARGPIATTQRGRLVVIAKSGADGPSYPFGDLLDVGRVEGNVIVAEDGYLSPRHVRILWTNGRLLLRDLSSANGVYLRLAPSRTIRRTSADDPEVSVALHDHDLILVGQQVFRFEILREAEGGFGPAQEHGTLLFGSPAAPRYARLCQRTVEGIVRDVYYIRKAETVLGRESGDVVFSEDPFLSRRHAAIRLLSSDGSSVGDAKPSPGEMRFSLVDLGSSNGTFLRIRSEVELVTGDHFRVGQQLFRVDFDGASR